MRNILPVYWTKEIELLEEQLPSGTRCNRASTLKRKPHGNLKITKWRIFLSSTLLFKITSDKSGVYFSEGKE